MKLSEDHLKTLMLSIHQKIEEIAEHHSSNIETGKTEDSIVYPPGSILEANEIAELDKIKNNSILKSALKKIIADGSANVVFDLFNLIDGTGDPDEEIGEWEGIHLVDYSDDFEENDEMLHDNFFGSYWDWKK
tara:strand:+ start:680 stop:1078 length:399 start_codon:yes stop_codon:yes gene_type:complete